PPSPVPTYIRPINVGSATTAVTLPVAPASGPPNATPPKLGISLINGRGPSAFHAKAAAACAESVASRAALATAVLSCKRICTIAARYAPGGTPKFSPRRLSKNASRVTRSRASNDPGALRLARADRDVARIGKDRTTPRPNASSKPPAAARSSGEKRLDKAKTPFRPASSSHSILAVYMNQLYNEYLVDYLFSIGPVYLSIPLPMIGSAWPCRCTRQGWNAGRMNPGYDGQAAAIRKPIFGK